MYSTYTPTYENYGAYALAASPISSLLSLAFTIFNIVCLWKIFVKANEPGWKCLIPVYGSYMLFKIAWKGSKFWQLLLWVFGGVMIGTIMMLMESEIAIILGSVLMVVGIISGLVINIKFYIRLAHAFGKSGGFAAGLIFLSFIFQAILAFDKSEYLGPQE